MKIYCMSDIHGCLAEFCDALSLVTEHLHEKDTMLLLLGDYVHGGPDNRGVLDRVMALQEQYGSDKVVAGHIGTAELAGDPRFHDIYFDGASHYYIDGTVLDSGVIPVLMVDTAQDRYYRVTESGLWPVGPYGEE